MRPARPSSQRGFTLIELMIVVAIIGVLSAIAIPSLIRYIKKSKTSEALQQLEKIKSGARAYFQDERPAPGGMSMLPRQFPATAATTPAVNCCDGNVDRCTPDAEDWDTPTWDGLQFSIDDPHYYRYEFVSQGTGADAEFTARAYGDLDCDGDLSTFYILGEAAGGGEVNTSAKASRIRELE